jgi:hypothetical protein
MLYHADCYVMHLRPASFPLRECTAYASVMEYITLPLFGQKSFCLQINMHKADKELSEIAARWEEIKKGTSQVQTNPLLLQSMRTSSDEACGLVCDNPCSQLSHLKYGALPDIHHNW